MSTSSVDRPLQPGDRAPNIVLDAISRDGKIALEALFYEGRVSARRRPRSRLVPIPIPVSGPEPHDRDDERQRQEEDECPVELIEPLQPDPDIEEFAHGMDDVLDGVRAQ